MGPAPVGAKSVRLGVLRRRVSIDTLPDEALMAGLATGDRQLEAAFVARFERRVYGLAISMLGDAHLAEDIAQEALLRAWRHAPMFDPRRGSVATWLLSITRNLAIDVLRVRRAQPIDPSSAPLVNLLSDTSGPEDTAMRSNTAGRVRAALAALPEDQRRALILATFYGFTAAETAYAEGIPLGTAKTRIRSGMTKMRASLVGEATP